MFKIAFVLVTFNFVLFITTQAFATETPGEKIQVVVKDSARAVKSATHRTEEVFCASGELKCGLLKIENRVLEAKDATLDGVVNIKNKIN